MEYILKNLIDYTAELGHVFQGRFKGILVQKDNYLLKLSRYIVLNSVRAKMVASAANWIWSSYLAIIQPKLKTSWLSSENILSLLSDDVSDAIKIYQEFVNQDIRNDSPWDNLRNQIFLGAEDFVQEMLNKIEPERNLLGIPKVQFTPDDGLIETFEKNSANRNECIRLAYERGNLLWVKLEIILDYIIQCVSRIVKNFTEKANGLKCKIQAPTP